MAFLQDSQPDLCLLAKSGGCSVYQLRNESGEGTMTVYEVFPGATILYNDFHMAYCDSSFETQQDLLCIDYCREGRMETILWIWLPFSGNSARMPGHGSFTEHPRWITFFRSCVPYRSGSKCPTFG